MENFLGKICLAIMKENLEWWGGDSDHFNQKKARSDMYGAIPFYKHVILGRGLRREGS
jgi:hypothetical protein